MQFKRIFVEINQLKVTMEGEMGESNTMIKISSISNKTNSIKKPKRGTHKNLNIEDSYHYQVIKLGDGNI